MKHLFTLCVPALLLIAGTAMAQKKVPKPDATAAAQNATIKRRNDEIRFQARNQIAGNLSNLLNILTFEDTGEAERNSIIPNSYLPNSNQLFYDDNVIIEDDIDPTHTSPGGAVDVSVEKYLRNLSLFYSKTPNTSTISFSQVLVSDVIQGDNYLYVKVTFTSTFSGKHSQISTPYKPVQRVAELRAEFVNKKWRTYITRVAFQGPVTDLPPPGPELLFGQTNHLSDSVTLRKDEKRLNIVRSSTTLLPVGSYYLDGKSYTNPDKSSITFTDKDKLFIYKQAGGNPVAFRQIKPGEGPGGSRTPPSRLMGWVQIITGVAALGASYVGYSSLQSSYKGYTAKLTNLNTEYTIWQGLTQQSGGASPAAPVSFSSYASPGIYGVYGGGAIGTGLILKGIRQVLRKRK